MVSPLILRGRGVTAHFEDRSVLLEQDGVHRRIPVRAIREVRAAGGGDTVEIELTSAGGAPTVFMVSRSSPAAVAAFVSAVTSALPEGRAPRDGMELVTEEASEAPAWRLFLARRTGAVVAAVGVVAVWAALVVHAAAAGAPGRWLMPVFGVPLLLGVGRFVRLGAGIARDHRSTRRHGITVAADFAGRNSANKETWRFTDAEGRERLYVGSGRTVSRDPRRIEVRYDPRRPDELYAPQPAILYVVVGAVLGPMLAGILTLGLGLAFWPLAEALAG